MIKNYLKTAIRNLLKNKGYSAINVSSLALGMSICMLLLLWVQYQLSFDQFHVNRANIYHIEHVKLDGSGTDRAEWTPYPMYDALNGKIEGVKAWSRYKPLNRFLVEYNGKQFYEFPVRAVDSSFLKMFTFPLKYGNVNRALSTPNSIVLSEKVSAKYFGNENPIGKILTINNKYSLVVSGVIDKLPENSSFRFNILVPYEFAKQIGYYGNNWRSNDLNNFVQLNSSAYRESAGRQITDTYIDNVYGPHTGISREKLKNGMGEAYKEFALAPFSDIHLYGFGASLKELLPEIRLFTILAFIILIIGCINYMNLAAARSINRAKEIGLRKVVGASKMKIILQFYGESCLLSFISAIISLFLVILFLPAFGSITGINFTVLDVFSSQFLLYIAATALAAAIISGSYPALFLSSFQPIQALKNHTSSSSKGSPFRKILVVSQFSLSIIFLVTTAAVYQQLDYTREAKLGFDKDQLLFVPLRASADNYPVVKDELIKRSGIVNVTSCWNIPTDGTGGGLLADWEGKAPGLQQDFIKELVDFDYVKTMGIEIKEGRNFSKEFPSDSTNALLINEEAAKVIGKSSPVGMVVSFTASSYRPHTIIGVMKNYLFDEPGKKIKPLCLMLHHGNRKPSIMAIRLQKNNVALGLENLKSVWQKVNPQYPLEYSFFDESLEQAFSDDRQMGEILKYSAIFAIFIASIGLLGLAAYITGRRKKEIGIRKVLGASASGITFMLTKQFVIWVVVANLISAPVSVFLIYKWHENYAFKAPVSLGIFIMAALATVLLALLTIGYTTVKAALSNPAESIRNE
jgi:putative ABC transport system permease protein